MVPVVAVTLQRPLMAALGVKKVLGVLEVEVLVVQAVRRALMEGLLPMAVAVAVGTARAAMGAMAALGANTVVAVAAEEQLLVVVPMVALGVPVLLGMLASGG